MDELSHSLLHITKVLKFAKGKYYIYIYCFPFYLSSFVRSGRHMMGMLFISVLPRVGAMF